MAERPRGAVALVTGGSRGIGAATANALAADGWPVAVTFCSREDAALRVVAKIERAGGRACALHFDAHDRDAPTRLPAAAATALDGPVLALVNNAGIREDDLAISLSDESWDRVVETNLSAAFRVTRAALGPMLRARWGRVVNVASVVGPRANAGQANYAAAKAGLVAMTATVAVEVARRGVTVNAVAPGLIDTDLTAGIEADGLGGIPARRAGTPAEVASCVRFLASDGAAYVTGSTLYVDGGLAA